MGYSQWCHKELDMTETTQLHMIEKVGPIDRAPLCRPESSRTLSLTLFFFLAMWDLVPQPGIEPTPPALEAQGLNCTAREVLVFPSGSSLLREEDGGLLFPSGVSLVGGEAPLFRWQVSLPIWILRLCPRAQVPSWLPLWFRQPRILCACLLQVSLDRPTCILAVT